MSNPIFCCLAKNLSKGRLLIVNNAGITRSVISVDGYGRRLQELLTFWSIKVLQAIKMM